MGGAPVWAEHDTFQDSPDDPWILRVFIRLIRLALYAIQTAIYLAVVLLIGALVVDYLTSERTGVSSERQMESTLQAQDRATEELLEERDYREGVATATEQASERSENDRASEADYRDKIERDYEGQMGQAYNEGRHAAAPISAPYDPSDVDCEDFITWDHADAFFKGAGGPDLDLYWLDDDGDGIPCELLPSWEDVYGS